MNRISRILRVVTLPETRRAVIAVSTSPTLRDIVHRARRDRAGLLRDLRHPGNARELARNAVRHPVTRELADAGLLLLPMRYLPLGWVASKAADRVLRRYVDPPAAVIEATAFGRDGALKDVTPAPVSVAEPSRDDPPSP